MNLLKNAIISLESTGTLPVYNRPHKLKGQFSGYFEAHLKPDWLIIWLRQAQPASSAGGL